MNPQKLSISDLKDLCAKRVLVRVDYNVPLDENGNITDDTRIKATLPTIQYLINSGAKIILCSHLGRPKGKRDPKQSLKPCAEALGKMLDRPVAFVDDCIGEKVDAAVAALRDGDILLLENLRFYPEEEKNDPAFCEKLAQNADVYVNDAFGTAHRAHASTDGVARLIQKRGGPCAAGFLMEKELKYLGEALANPARPFVCILGGAKVSDKINVIENLMKIADVLLIGGAMAYTFRKAQGYNVGASLCEHDKLDMARALLEKAKGKNFYLPLDHIQAAKVEPGAPTEVTPDPNIRDGWHGVDIGPKTIEQYKQILSTAKTVIWNGPMGVFEIPDFAKGTFEIARAVAEITAKNAATTIIGGGDSAKAVKKAKVQDQVAFVSTGGGATLEFLEGKLLPGVAALNDKT
ncbi:MAG: phosphoglycerate kinase [Verrucomicrobiae bacterium]|nr:phosphoglycerate kinase [Verrucomicrobiae bacterium]